MSPDDVLRALYDWPAPWNARDEQLPPEGDWRTWLVLAGRGFGKTRCGAEWVRARAEGHPGCRIALVGRTAADVRDVMVGGPAGLLAVCPPWNAPAYEPSKRAVTWPNGSVATAFSAEEPDLLRGPQHHYAWCDELAAWRYQDETWSNLVLGLRLGDAPRTVVTTTPRPTPLVRALFDRAAKGDGVVLTRGRTADNAANVAASYLDEVYRRYEGTRLGQQELDGTLLLDTPGALWTWDTLARARMGHGPLPAMRRVVVALDPAVSTGPHADEFGIVVVGLGVDGRGYVLDDASGKYTPDAWSREALRLYAAHGCDAVVGEVNQGGDLVEHTLTVTARELRQRHRFVAVRATRGKAVRAEPAAALYEQGRVSHAGHFARLEDQMTTWDATDTTQPSPDRVDALVWALTELFVLSPPPAPYRASPGAPSRWKR